MKSKTLFVSNLIASIYSLYLLVTFGGALAEAGGLDYVEALAESFEILFQIFGTDFASLNLAYALLIGLCIHIVAFTLGALLGWIALLRGKSKGAKAAARLYLIATVCFPVYLFFGLPITILGFIAAKKQRQLERS